MDSKTKKRINLFEEIVTEMFGIISDPSISPFPHIGRGAQSYLHTLKCSLSDINDPKVPHILEKDGS